MKVPADTAEMPTKDCTAMIGGIAGMLTIREADAWLRDRLRKEWGSDPIDMNGKGAYKHLAFARFKNHADREAAIKALHEAVENGKEIWAKEALPVEVHAPRGCLLGLKYTLKT